MRKYRDQYINLGAEDLFTDNNKGTSPYLKTEKIEVIYTPSGITSLLGNLLKWTNDVHKPMRAYELMPIDEKRIILQWLKNNYLEN